MKKLTNNKTIRFSDAQMDSLRKLEDYNVNVSKFVRLAIAEKIKRDWKSIKEKKKEYLYPF
jgi:hypothetical protein